MRMLTESLAFARRVYSYLRRPRLGMRKYEIANTLARQFKYSSYLEICTANTGHTFAKVNNQQFPQRMRLMYRCPRDFSDGQPIDFRAESEPGEEVFAEVMNCGRTFDFVFVDSWHTYESSLRDIVFALRLVNDHGVVMITIATHPRLLMPGRNFTPKDGVE